MWLSSCIAVWQCSLVADNYVYIWRFCCYVIILLVCVLVYYKMSAVPIRSKRPVKKQVSFDPSNLHQQNPGKRNFFGGNITKSTGNTSSSVENEASLL